MDAGAAVILGSVGAGDHHATPAWHPESAARVHAVDDAIARLNLGDAVTILPPRLATIGELARVHDELYLDGLATLAEAGGGELDPETVVSVGSWETARLSAGLGLAAIDALQQDAAGAAFLVTRPPGHHASRVTGSGFCLLNNVAVTAAALVDQGARVAIIDWDVHHGNGTQAVFWNNPQVLYVSTHEWPAYPGTGDAAEVGGPAALGRTLNIPLPAGATGDVALRAFDDVVEEAVDAFAPDWVLISAGYDAHRDDPLADLAWSAGDYAVLTRRVMGYAPGAGRTIVFLEGGYDLRALGESVAATVAALAGVRHDTEDATVGGPGMDAVDRARRRRTDRLERMA
ncbi:MAG TPA: histone deacetylase [Acidimicrobiales bacterium]|nr:histone deacetylase [Acidimicrobiales bacterium]